MNDSGRKLYLEMTVALVIQYLFTMLGRTSTATATATLITSATPASKSSRKITKYTVSATNAQLYYTLGIEMTVAALVIATYSTYKYNILGI